MDMYGVRREQAGQFCISCYITPSTLRKVGSHQPVVHAHPLSWSLERSDLHLNY